MRYKEASRTEKLEFHGIITDAEIGKYILFRNMHWAFFLDLTQTKPNKRKRNEEIHSESVASQLHVWVATPLFIRLFDILNFYISCTYLGIIKVAS